MNIISEIDQATFLMLFNRDGYVLDFSDKSFDMFTLESVGVAIKKTCGLSKGKSLEEYLSKASDADRTKLLVDMFRYYEEKMEYEYNQNLKELDSLGNEKKYNEKYAKIYEACKKIISKVSNGSVIVIQTAAKLKEQFSSAHLSKQIDSMLENQFTNPTLAIGLAKDLIESCCKTILDKKEIAYTKNEDVTQLTNKVMDALDLLPASVNSEAHGASSIKALLGNLRAIPTKLAEMRNSFGSGHGKTASFMGLEERHAKLAVFSSIMFVEFIWDTFESQHN